MDAGGRLLRSLTSQSKPGSFSRPNLHSNFGRSVHGRDGYSATDLRDETLVSAPESATSGRHLKLHPLSLGFTPGQVFDIGDLTESPTGTSSQNLHTESESSKEAPILFRGKDHSVEAANLSGLFNELVHPLPYNRRESSQRKENRRDSEHFLQAFLLTHTIFASNEEVFLNLISLFNGGHCEEEKRNVLIIMSRWVENGSSHFEPSLLRKIMDFIPCARDVSGLEELVASLSNQVNERSLIEIQEELRSPTSASFLVVSKDVLTPRDLALALTVIQAGYQKQLLPADYIRLASRPDEDPFSDLNTRIFYWVTQSILSPENVIDRLTRLEIFALMAEECRRSRNFQGLSSIVDALQSSYISALRLVKGLSRDLEETFTANCAILERYHNYRCYRNALKESAAPTIPLLCIHLEDLRKVWQKYPTRITRNGCANLINFTKCTELAKTLKSFLHYRAPDFSKDQMAGPVAYLRNELKETQFGAEVDATFAARSHVLRKRKEDKKELKRHIYELRLREFGHCV